MLWNRFKASIILLILGGTIGIALLLNSVQAATMITVYPTESTAILKNPNRGFMGYANSTITDNRFSQEIWDRISVGYLRCSWSELESSEGVYNWDIIDNSMSACVAKGSKLGLAIMSANVNSDTNYKQSTPLWVFSAGANYTTECNKTVKIPVWDDPVYKAKLQNFITALKNRYDSNNNLAFIDIRNYGNWGEWHLSGLPNSLAISEEQQKNHIDMWGSFTKNLMAINHGGSVLPSAQYAVNTYKTGMRMDGCLHPDYPDVHKSLAYVYDITPATAEWWYKYSDFKSLGKWQPIMFERVIKEGKPSYMGLSMWDESTFYSEQSGLISRWINRIGYWFKIVKATFPSDLGNGTTGTITFRIKNDGVAPIYPNKNNVGYVKLALMDNNNAVLQTVTLADINPFNWKPGVYQNESASFSFSQNAMAAKLAIGIFTSNALPNPDVKLGVGGDRVNNWHILNSMPTTEDSNLSANKLYSASKEWADSGFGYREARYAFDNNDNTSWIADNLLNNTGFEEGLSGWKSYSGGNIAPITTPVYSGTAAAKVYNRTSPYNGIGQDITSVLMANGKGQYNMQGWLRVDSGMPKLGLRIIINDSEGKHYYSNSGTVNSTGWTQISSVQNITWSGTLTSATFYIESADTSLQDIYVDNCSLSRVESFGSGAWLQVDLGENKTFTQAYLKEKNVRISGYKIQYYNGTSWVDAYTGTNIGAAGITVSFPAQTGSKVRLYTTSSSGWPDICEFKILQ